MLNRLLKLPCLVGIVAEILARLSLLLAGDLGLLLLGKSLFLLLLAPALVLSGLLGCFFGCSLALLLLFLLLLHLVGLHIHEINSCELLEDVHQTRVHLH